MRDHRTYKAFQLADSLAVAVYRNTLGFPADEVYGLRNQIRRCAVSVPSNIVEGFGRSTKRDLLHFLDIAFGSLRELEYQISLAHRLSYFTPVQFGELAPLIDETVRVLRGLIRSIREGGASVQPDQP